MIELLWLVAGTRHFRVVLAPNSASALDFARNCVLGDRTILSDAGILTPHEDTEVMPFTSLDDLATRLTPEQKWCLQRKASRRKPFRDSPKEHDRKLLVP